MHDDDIFLRKIFAVIWAFFVGVFLSVWFFCPDLIISRGNFNSGKLYCTVLEASHSYRGMFGIPTYRVVFEIDGEIFTVNDETFYYLYRDKEGEVFPCEIGEDFLFGYLIDRHVRLFNDYGVSWAVDDSICKQQSREVLGK